MKVVLFCGGLGTRLREHSETIPKPLVNIGYRPILWHLMRYYAHFGHKDFILCLGYRGDMIREYFLNYREEMATDFVMTRGGGKIELLGPDIGDWRITFVDTGMHSNLGERLSHVRGLLDGEERFLANYSDGLTNLPLPLQLEHFRRHGAIASFVSVKPRISYHVVTSDQDGRVTAIDDISRTNIRINGGYFIFKKQIFNYMKEKEELVIEPFQRLLKEKQLIGYSYDGFWESMDTFKDRQHLESLYAAGQAPWEIWKKNGSKQ